MAKILPMPKRMTESQAMDYVSTQHRVDEYVNRMESHLEVDKKAWTWARVIFYILVIALVSGVLVWKEAHACGEMESEQIEIKVRGI